MAGVVWKGRPAGLSLFRVERFIPEWPAAPRRLGPQPDALYSHNPFRDRAFAEAYLPKPLAEPAPVTISPMSRVSPCSIAGISVTTRQLTPTPPVPPVVRAGAALRCDESASAA